MVSMFRKNKSQVELDNQSVAWRKNTRFSDKKIIGVILAAYLTIYLSSSTVSIDLSKTVGNLYFVMVPSAFALFTILLAINSPPRERKLLTIFALFAVFRAIAEILWIIYESVLFIDTFPSIADFFWLTGYVFISIFFYLYFRPLKNITSNSIKLVATLVASAHLIPTSMAVYMLNPNLNYFEFLVSLAYPIADTVFLWQVTAGLMPLFHKKHNLFLSLMMMGIIGFIVADTLFVFMTNSYEVGSPIDAGWGMGYLLFLFAVFNYQSLNKKDIQAYIQDNKKLSSEIKLETLIKFVIPIITMAIIFVAASILVNHHFADLDGRQETYNDMYFFALIIGAFTAIIFIQNKNLLKFVKMRTVELEREKNRLQIEVADKIAELKKAERMYAIGELSARIAHDFRNPLSIIKSGVELIKIKDYSLSKQTQEILPRIDRAVVRMSHQIDNVLDYVTPKPLQLKKIKVSELLEVVMERIVLPEKVILKSSHNDFDFICDPYKMEIVFVNLITNAIQAVSNEGIITIRAIENKKEFVFEIEDTGPGVPDDIVDKIFDPLFTTRFVGTGLGLPSCKSIVEKHEGTISVSTKIGKGTTFVIKIPKYQD